MEQRDAGIEAQGCFAAKDVAEDGPAIGRQRPEAQEQKAILGHHLEAQPDRKLPQNHPAPRSMHAG